MLTAFFALAALAAPVAQDSSRWPAHTFCEGGEQLVITELRLKPGASMDALRKAVHEKDNWMQSRGVAPGGARFALVVAGSFGGDALPYFEKHQRPPEPSYYEMGRAMLLERGLPVPHQAPGPGEREVVKAIADLADAQFVQHLCVDKPKKHVGPYPPSYHSKPPPPLVLPPPLQTP